MLALFIPSLFEQQRRALLVGNHFNKKKNKSMNRALLKSWILEQVGSADLGIRLVLDYDLNERLCSVN